MLIVILRSPIAGCQTRQSLVLETLARIHGELEKLRLIVSEAPVTGYMKQLRPSPSQSWSTFLKNHAGRWSRSTTSPPHGLDHVMIFHARHLRAILDEYVSY